MNFLLLFLSLFILLLSSSAFTLRSSRASLYQLTRISSSTGDQGGDGRLFDFFSGIFGGSKKSLEEKEMEDAAFEAKLLNEGKKARSDMKTMKKLDPAQSEYFNRPGPWDDKNLNSLLDANKTWRARMLEQNPQFFEDQKKGHFPKILWIGTFFPLRPGSISVFSTYLITDVHNRVQ